MFTRLCGVYIIVQSTLDSKFASACSSQAQNRKFRVYWMQSNAKKLKKIEIKKRNTTTMSKSSGPGELSHTLIPTLGKQRQGQEFKVILSE